MELDLRAEVLITRKCNLRCNYCGLVDNERQELTLEQWKRGFKLLFDVLNVKMLCILGGEPLVLGIDYLCELSKYLSQFKDRKFAFVSNCVGITDSDIDKLINAGVNSWATSIDAIGDSNIKNAQKYKSQQGLKTLLKFKENGLKNLMGIITVNKKNIKNVIPTVDALLEYGIIPNVEICHYKRGPYNIFCADKEALKDDLLDYSYFEEIKKMASELIRRSSQYNFFQIPEFFELWLDSKKSIELKWNCRHFSFMAVDSDGSLGVCDDYFPPDMAKINILDLGNTNKEDFKKLWLKNTAKCPGCFMSSHVSSDLYVDEMLTERSARIINSNYTEALEYNF